MTFFLCKEVAIDPDHSFILILVLCLFRCAQVRFDCRSHAALRPALPSEHNVAVFLNTIAGLDKNSGSIVCMVSPAVCRQYSQS